MKYFSVKNLKKYQHYKDRNPPWIKVYTNLFEDYNFSCLQDASKMHLIGIWLLASKIGNKLPWDEKWLESRISASTKINLKILLELEFIEMVQDASALLAECLQDAIPETEQRERQSRAEQKVTLQNLSLDIFDSNELRELTSKYPAVDFTELIGTLKDYCLSKGKKYSDYKAALRNWAKREQQEKNNGISKQNIRQYPATKKSVTGTIAEELARINSKLDDEVLLAGQERG